VSLTPSDLKRYKAVCFNGLHNAADMHANEMSFLSDMSEKLEKYERDSFVSFKQADWLDKLETKLMQQLGAEYQD